MLLGMPKTNSKTTVGIIGFGEVGQAMAKFYKNPLIKDLNRDDGFKKIDVLHICIPYNKNFVRNMAKEIKAVKPKLTIVHSTVAPGTTKKLINLTRNKMIVHSPVRGVHPHLYEGIKTFVKFIGAENRKAGQAAKKHLNSLGIKTRVVYPAKTTELGKLLDTTYYGLVIAWHGEMEKICDKEKVDFEKVATAFNKTYNEGYKKLGKINVIRPILSPPEKGCGGHCMLENSILLKESFPAYSQTFDFILSMGKNKNFIPEEKPHLNRTWLYAEYWGRGRTAKDIAKEMGCTETNILAIMRRKNIPRRDRKWTKSQINKILKLSENKKSFKEIAKEFEGEKTYNAIRNLAYKTLKIKSGYNPAIINEETRRKISTSLQGIELEDWDGFKEDINALIRKSIAYQKWRGKVFKRDKYTCQKCKETGKYIIAHHITNFAQNPKVRIDPKNGITLCKGCHLNFHNQYGRKNNNDKQLRAYLNS